MPEAYTSTVVLLSKGLARYRHNFTEHFAAALPPDVRVIACPLGDQYWEVNFPALKAQHGRVEYRNFPRSVAELAAMRPTVLCTMEYPPKMLRPMFWAKRHGIPVVVFSDLGKHPPKQHQIPWRTRLQHQFFARFTDAQVAMAPAAMTSHGARHRPVLFAPHSVDTHDFTYRPAHPSGKCVLLYVANYAYHKGHDLLVQALLRIRQQHDVEFELRLVGYSDPAWLRGIIAQAGLEDVTTITGILQGQALIDEFQRADLFVFPSRGDTYGVVAQEAAASGLPIVISRFAGASYNLVHEGVNGHIIDPHDTSAFAARLGALMTSPARWQAMGTASRTIAERYCVRRTARNVADWLLPVLEGSAWLPVQTNA